MDTAIAERTNLPANHPVATREEWMTARKKLLEREKALTRLGDEVARERRALPWVAMDKNYLFDTPDGRRPLADLFDGHHQLVMQHFMLPPGWQQGCKSCSYMADHTDPTLIHLAHRDTAFVAVSRAPLADIERFRERMGWRFRWVSSDGTDFNRDFGVTFTADEIARGEADYNYRGMKPGQEMPGVSVFYRDEAGTVFHTYSTYGRGVEVMMHTYRLLDLTPKGRDENGRAMGWVRHHDRYETQPAQAAGSCGGR